MRYMKYAALLAVLMVPLTYSQAQVRIGVGVGFGPGYVAGPPVCQYGYYDYAPYACAPYGFYGPSWFSSGVFIGAGPWYHGYYGRSAWGPRFYGRGGWDRGYVRSYDRGWGRGYDRGGWGDRRGNYGHEGFEGRGFARSPERGFHGNPGFRGNGGGSRGEARGSSRAGGERRR